MKQAQDIGDESNTAEYVKNLLSSGGRVMGFGHRVYKTADPRALILKIDAKDLSDRKGNPKWFAVHPGILTKANIETKISSGISSKL